jgi:SAM-dependent methyltransferase
MRLRLVPLLLLVEIWLPHVFGQKTPAPAAKGRIISGSKEQWDESFRDPAIRRTEPDQVLVSAIADRKPGSAIDLGMGQGRNALYLAEKGWRTTGVDFSEVAVSDARAEAHTRGVMFDAVVADLDKYDLGSGKWDLILYSYMQYWLKTSPLDPSGCEKPSGQVAFL